MKRKTQEKVGAAGDDPRSIIERAIHDAETATGSEKYNLKVRNAANLGWLAASSSVDVVAGRLGLAQRKNPSSRMSLLREIERHCGTRRGTLTGKFVAARETLHRACFHENRCDRDTVLGLLEEAKELVGQTLEVKRKRKV